MVPLINAAFAIETFFEGTRTDDPRLADMMNQGEFLLAEDAAGQVVASVYLERRGSRAYLGMLAVEPAHQGEGLARMLVGAAEEHCRKLGCVALDLTVLSLRPDLPPFYRKLGYAQIGTEEFKPSRPLKAGMQCHCIVMSKEL